MFWNDFVNDYKDYKSEESLLTVSESQFVGDQDINFSPLWSYEVLRTEYTEIHSAFADAPETVQPGIQIITFKK